jgi:hypothetical protein
MRGMHDLNSRKLCSSAVPHRAEPKNASADHPSTRVRGMAGLWMLTLLASAACTTSDGGTAGAGGSRTGGSATASGGQVTTGGSGGGTTVPQGSGGGPGKGGGTAGTTTGGLASGGVGAGGKGAGGAGAEGVGGSRTGGVGPGTGGGPAGGAGNAGTGGAGSGGVSTGPKSTGGISSGGAAGAGTGPVGTGGVAGGSATGPGGAGGVAGSSATGPGGTGGGGSPDTVTRTTSTFKFTHFPIQTNSDGVWNGSSTPGTQTTSTTYDTVVLENGYLKVTLLPKYGGRILSILHKPTNRELLYQNPIGTPYLMLEGIFYYDYLVIMGGIFPSFPEPEHGKYWNQPYDLKVVSETKDAITVRMSRQDDLNVASGVPSKYDVGRTDVLVELDVTLRAGSSSLELGTKLTNTRSKSIPKFEYWTNTTLAPGSTPGNTAIPVNTRILAVMDKVHLMESSWSWFGKAEERVSGEIFKWKNLVKFENWADQGIAYASPDYRANWSGLMNDDNSTGIIRVSENVRTPGLKIWTFGKGSVTTDIKKSSEWLRPTIEMWHGVTQEFWTRGSMAASEVRQWSDTYFPTFGLKDITAASQNGALYLSSSKGTSETTLNLAATPTLPKQTVKAVLRLNGSTVAERDVVVSATDATTVSATVTNDKISAGAVFQAELLQGDTSLLSGQVTLP